MTQYGSAQDALNQNATAVDQRADIVRFYEDARSDWCMARAFGDVTSADYVEHLKNLQFAAIAALIKPAEASDKTDKKEGSTDGKATKDKSKDSK